MTHSRNELQPTFWDRVGDKNDDMVNTSTFSFMFCSCVKTN